MCPVVVEVDYEAEDEVELAAFINWLIKFGDRRVRVKRIYHADRPSI